MTTPTRVSNPFADRTSKTPDCQGYHPVALVADGELLCEHCVLDPFNPVIDGTGPGHRVDDPSDEQWTVVSWMASDVLDADDQCSHCYRKWVTA